MAHRFIQVFTDKLALIVPLDHELAKKEFGFGARTWS
jgi:hypothetical protein